MIIYRPLTPDKNTKLLVSLVLSVFAIQTVCMHVVVCRDSFFSLILSSVEVLLLRGTAVELVVLDD